MPRAKAFRPRSSRSSKGSGDKSPRGSDGTTQRSAVGKHSPYRRSSCSSTKPRGATTRAPGSRATVFDRKSRLGVYCEAARDWTPLSNGARAALRPNAWTSLPGSDRSVVNPANVSFDLTEGLSIPGRNNQRPGWAVNDQALSKRTGSRFGTPPGRTPWVNDRPHSRLRHIWYR